MKKSIAVTILLFAINASADVNDRYLACDNSEDQVQLVRISDEGTLGRINILSGDSEFSGSVVYLETKKLSLTPLLKNSVKEMDGKTLKQKKLSMSFRIDGRDASGNPRLEIKVTGAPHGDFVLSSCVPYKSARAGI